MNDAALAAIWAVIGAAVTGFFAWLAQRGKSSAEIEVAVLAEWQKLNVALSNRVSALEAQLAEVRAKHAQEIEEMRNKHRAEMRALRELNEGLQRQIAQNSTSSAQLLGDIGKGKSNGER